MDDRWRVQHCGLCQGGTLFRETLAGPQASECPYCCCGTVWLRPSGHAFAYPGGPALGMLSQKDYEVAHPVEAF